MNFKTAEFNKTIILNLQDNANIDPFADSKYELVRLGEILENIGKGKRPASFKNKDGSVDFYTSSLEIYKCFSYDFDMEALIVGDGGNASIHYANGKFSSSDHTYVFTNTSDQAILRYVYLVVRNNLDILELGLKGIGLKNIGKKFIENEIKIPLPPLEIQKQIVKECDEVESYTRNIDNLIKAYEDLIKAVLFKANITTEATSNDLQSLLKIISDLELSLDSKNAFNADELESLLDSVPTPSRREWVIHRLSDHQKFDIQIGKRVLKNEVKEIGKIPVYSANVKDVFGYVDKEILKDYDRDSILWGIDGD